MRSTFKDGCVVDPRQPRAAGGIPLPEMNLIHMCCNVHNYTSISNHSSTAAYMIGLTFTSQKNNKPAGYKFRGLRAEMRLSMVAGLVCVVVCCVRPAGLPVCSLPRCGEGACCGKPTVTSWGSPAHKELRSRRLQPVCICTLLTSHLIALTHQLLLLRAGVIYLYTDFPQDEGRTN